jgi:Ribosomal S3Ae family
MTQGKNPGLKVGGKKGAKKRTVDPLSRKEWYDFKAPIPFSSKSFGKTLVTRSSGNSNYSFYFQNDRIFSLFLSFKIFGLTNSKLK